MNVPRMRDVFNSFCGLSTNAAYAIGLPATLFGLIIVYLPRIKNLPDATLPFAGFVMAPVYAVLLIEEKLGLHRLAKMLDERPVSTWPETAAVIAVSLVFLWMLNCWLMRGDHSLFIRVGSGLAVICLGCSLAFVFLMLCR